MTSPSDGHPTVSVLARDGRMIEIDVDLAPLIEGLWRHGVVTNQCCQENAPGLAWIGFPGPSDACAFLRAVGLDDPAEVELDDYDSLQSRCNPWTVADTDASHRDPWEWRWAALLIPSEDTVQVSVEFPRHDLPELIRRVNAK